MRRGIVALIALLLAGLTPASAAACKKAGWAPIDVDGNIKVWDLKRNSGNRSQVAHR